MAVCTGSCAPASPVGWMVCTAEHNHTCIRISHGWPFSSHAFTSVSGVSCPPARTLEQTTKRV